MPTDQRDTSQDDWNRLGIPFYTLGMAEVDGWRGHPMVTESVLKVTPALYATESVPVGEKRATAKWFSPSMTWYMVELDPETGEAFGYVENLLAPFCSEWGYFDLKELGELFVHNVYVERDLYYDGRIPE
jgi:hypothetical protein